ncbi:uncharacterized protein LOC115665156 isoform X2 [Syzygium oleosum]|uniref:uncharacterized protein LOC115665156 isoform X2 n=1 Tax=Syzygium oleosum TaxID=219896 RepID=UPI0024BA078D|nr:uncharacterized protein LOC115665156 isoform X2 [Syzygium oleosum]
MKITLRTVERSGHDVGTIRMSFPRRLLLPWSFRRRDPSVATFKDPTFGGFPVLRRGGSVKVRFFALNSISCNFREKLQLPVVLELDLGGFFRKMKSLREVQINQKMVATTAREGMVEPICLASKDKREGDALWIPPGLCTMSSKDLVLFFRLYLIS